MISSIPSDPTRGVARMNLGMRQAQMNLGIHVQFRTFMIIYKSFTLHLVDMSNIDFSSADVKKPAAKSSSKRTRVISSDEDDTQEELKPVKKKQMKQGSILDMMSKGEFLTK